VFCEYTYLGSEKQRGRIYEEGLKKIL